MKEDKSLTAFIKARESKEEKLMKELTKPLKLIFKRNKKAIEITVTVTSIDRKDRRKVNGRSWLREDLLSKRVSPNGGEHGR